MFGKHKKEKNSKKPLTSLNECDLNSVSGGVETNNADILPSGIKKEDVCDGPSNSCISCRQFDMNPVDSTYTCRIKWFSAKTAEQLHEMGVSDI